MHTDRPKQLGYRVALIHRHQLKCITLTQIYVFLLYFLSLAFVLSAAVVNNGQGLSTNGSCKTSVIICLVFYAGSKLSMWVYAFSTSLYTATTHISDRSGTYSS
jgi:hypothetical protein